MTQSYYDLKTIEDRRAWLAEENRKRCEAARAAKDGAAKGDADWDLDPSRVGRG